MAISQADRTLRLVTCLVFIPAFGVLVPFGATRGHVVPPLGLIPMGFSALWALVQVNHRPKQRGINMFIELFITAFLFAIIVPSLLIVRHGGSRYGYRSYGDTSRVMMGTIGISMMLVDL